MNRLATEATPRSPLPYPIQVRRDGAQILLGDTWPTADDRRHEEERLLDIRRQAKQVHDPRHARACHMANACQLIAA
jgi:hypothetical protein